MPFCDVCRGYDLAVKQGHMADAIRYQNLAMKRRQIEREREYAKNGRVDLIDMFQQEYLGKWPSDDVFSDYSKPTRKRAPRKNKTLERFLRHGRG
jgi:hypothetical protein